MEVLFYLSLLLLSCFTRGYEVGRLTEDEGENDEKKDETIANESFGAPVYGVNGAFKTAGLGAKSGYNPALPALPASYGAYLTNLGLSNPYAYGPYSRYAYSPYAYNGLYGYGSYLNNPAFNSALLSGLGYAGYGGPYFGRSVYPGYGYGYPAYNSALGYRYGGLGYPPAPLRGSPAPLPAVPAPVAGVPAPARYPSPVAPLPVVPNAIPGVPAPVPGPYRPPLRPVQGKDGSVRYVPADFQALPPY